MKNTAKPKAARKAKGENFPEEHEVVALLAAAKKSNERDYMLLYLAANLGTRRGETVSLNRGSMRDVRNGVVLVARLKVPGHPIDQVAVSAPIIETICDYMKRMPASQQILFPSRQSHRDHITGRAADQIFDKYKAKAGLRKNLVFHSLRHFKGWKVWQATRNIKAVQKFLGHRSETTSWIYSHCPFEEQLKIADDLGEVK